MATRASSTVLDGVLGSNGLPFLGGKRRRTAPSVPQRCMPRPVASRRRRRPAGQAVDPGDQLPHRERLPPLPLPGVWAVAAGGVLLRREDGLPLVLGQEDGADGGEPGGPRRQCAEVGGVDVHAATFVAPHRRTRLEQLATYLAHPAGGRPPDLARRRQGGAAATAPEEGRHGGDRRACRRAALPHGGPGIAAVQERPGLLGGPRSQLQPPSSPRRSAATGTSFRSAASSRTSTPSGRGAWTRGKTASWPTRLPVGTSESPTTSSGFRTTATGRTAQALRGRERPSPPGVRGRGRAACPSARIRAAPAPPPSAQARAAAGPGPPPRSGCRRRRPRR